MTQQRAKEPPLSGVRVVELGSFIAGPFLTRLLADFGAEVIKVESPGQGDPIRIWGKKVEKGKSVWWSTQSRNKKCITLDLRQKKGQELARKLCQKADVVVENFRPGTLEKWGMGFEELQKLNSKLILVRISGYGQDGPYRDRAGFGVVGEAMGGLRYVTGYPDRAPTRVGISIGDSLAALYGALGTVMALFQQIKSGNQEGQVIDVALYEAVFAMMENSIGEYYKYGVNRERTGNILPKVAPSNVYKSKDGKWVIIAGNGDNVFKRLAEAMEKPEWNQDPKYNSHEARGEHQDELDQLITDWAAQFDAAELVDRLTKFGVPNGPIYNMADISQDPQYHARNMICKVHDEQLGDVHMPGIVPKMSATPGEIKWSGPAMGEHNEEVFRELLGLSKQEYDALRDDKVI